MYIPLKNNKRMLLELLMLKDPKFIRWILYSRRLYGIYLDANEEILNLMDEFDEKPILEKCRMKDCNKKGTRFKININTGGVFLFCDDCKLDDNGNPNKWSEPIYTYKQAIDFVRHSGTNTKTDYKFLINEIARAKGLPKRVGEKEAMKFFHERY